MDEMEVLRGDMMRALTAIQVEMIGDYRSLDNRRSRIRQIALGSATSRSRNCNR